MKTCRYCAEEIKDTAKVCKNCGKELSKTGRLLGYLSSGFFIGLIGVTAAAISAFMAYKSWQYNIEFSGPAVSLKYVDINTKILDEKRIEVNFRFVFENSGQETLIIKELHLGRYRYIDNYFELRELTQIINPIIPQSTFSKSTNLVFTVHPKLPSGSIEEKLKVIREKRGKHAFIFILKYVGTTSFSKEEKTNKLFYEYDGIKDVFPLNDKEYEEMKNDLPDEFKLDEY